MRFSKVIVYATWFCSSFRMKMAVPVPGTALGGTLDNTIVLDDCSVMNEDGLRWPDEFVRHKVLDLFGDLALLGSRLRGHVQVEKGGHTLHQRLVSAILSNPECWRLDHPDVRVAGAFAANRLQYANSR